MMVLQKMTWIRWDKQTTHPLCR